MSGVCHGFFLTVGSLFKLDCLTKGCLILLFDGISPFKRFFVLLELYSKYRKVSTRLIIMKN